MLFLRQGNSCYQYRYCMVYKQEYLVNLIILLPFSNNGSTNQYFDTVISFSTTLQ